MKNHIILAAALTATLFTFVGCNPSRSSDYPDRSVNTTRRVDDIKQNARDQKDAVDAEGDRLTNKMDFDERQIREKFKAERQSFMNAADKETSEREAKNREILIQAKHDKDVIDAEVVDTLKTSAPEKAAEIRADALSRKSAIDSRATANLAPMVSESERSKAKNIQRGLEIDLNESKDISALEQERAKARNQAKDKKLSIDTWTNDELAKVGKEADSNDK
jgi:hypothetical protein